MKKTIFNAKRAVMTLIAILTIGMAQVWALSGYETIIWSEQGLSEGGTVSLTANAYSTGPYFSITCAQGSASNSPKYYAANSGLRCYVNKNTVGGNKFTINRTSAGASASVRIMKIVYNATHNYSNTTYFTYSPTPASSTSTSATYNFSSNVTSAYVQVSTSSDNNSQCSLHSITVYYSDEDVAVGSSSIELQTTSNIPIASYDFGTTASKTGSVSLKVVGSCIDDLFDQGWYMFASISSGGSYFSIDKADGLESLSETITLSYSVAGNGTYEGNLNVYGFIGTSCPDYTYSGCYKSVDFPITLTVSGACVAPTVGAVTVTQPASESTNTKLTFACPTGVTNTGGCDITEHGYVYSSSNTTPTIGGSNCTKFKRGDGIAASTAYSTYGPTSLTCGTTYYVRAYAINAAGTSYSSAAASNSTHPCFVDHFIDDMHSTAGYTGTGMAKEGDYSASIPTIADKTERADGNCAERHYHFVGWVTEAHKADPTGHIETITGTATGTTYYAVWAQESSH